MGLVADIISLGVHAVHGSKDIGNGKQAGRDRDGDEEHPDGSTRQEKNGCKDHPADRTRGPYGSIVPMIAVHP